MQQINKNKNVIKLIDLFEGNKSYYLVLELIKGLNLFEELKLHT